MNDPSERSSVMDGRNPNEECIVRGEVYYEKRTKIGSILDRKAVTMKMNSNRINLSRGRLSSTTAFDSNPVSPISTQPALAKSHK